MSKVICVERQFGSGGHTIAKKVAEKLEYSYYDKKLLEEAVIRSGLSSEIMEKAEERATPFMYEAYFEGNLVECYAKSANDIMFEAEKQLILEAADRSDCVIVGRCASYILGMETGHQILHIFIAAPMEYRIRRVMERDGLDEKKAAARIRKMDKARKAYCEYYTGNDWGKPSDYDMILNPVRLGEEQAVSVIADTMGRIKTR